jgi:hypothetical protein
MKHCMAPALFTQLALQLDPLAILGLAMADGTPRTSKIAAAVNDQVVVRERFILQLLSYSSFIRRDCRLIGSRISGGDDIRLHLLDDRLRSLKKFR